MRPIPARGSPPLVFVPRLDGRAEDSTQRAIAPASAKLGPHGAASPAAGDAVEEGLLGLISGRPRADRRGKKSLG
jgi:hypothetical protein